MIVSPGYYTHNTESEKDTDDSLFRRLLSAGDVGLEKIVAYQSGERLWILLHAQEPIDLGVVDSLIWVSSFRAANANSKPEDTIPKDELDVSGHPLADALDENVLVPVKEAKDSLSELVRPTPLKLIVGFGILWILLRKS